MRRYKEGIDDHPFGPDYMHNESLALLLSADRQSKDAWKYTPAGQDGDFPVSGELAVYGGNGYGTELAVDIETANNTLVELKNNLWIDRQTRAIFLEFIVYNADSNVFSFISIWLEIPVLGGTILRTDATMIRIYATGFTGIYMRVVEVLFLVLLLTNMGISVYQVRSEETVSLCIKKPRVIIDIFLFTLSLLLVIVFILRFFTTRNLVNDLKGDVVHFTPFQKTVFIHALFTYLLGFVTTLAFVKFVILLRLVERFAKLSATLRHSALDILSTIFLISIGIFAFGVLGYLAFHQETEAYKTFFDSVSMLIGMGLGEFRGMERQLSGAKPLLQFYILTYMLFTQFIMFDILIAVIIDAHNTFKYKQVLHPKDHKLKQVIFSEVRQNVQKALDKYTQLDGAGYM